jgi:hypothetical protein
MINALRKLEIKGTPLNLIKRAPIKTKMPQQTSHLMKYWMLYCKISAVV